MAKPMLPTSFQDDVLSESMNGKRRFKITFPDGTEQIVTMEDVTEYEQVGSNFGAAQINNTNSAVNQSVDKATVIDNFEDVIANTQPGMPAGALALAELNRKSLIEREITGTTTDYGNLQLGLDPNMYNVLYAKSKIGAIAIPYIVSNGTDWAVNIRAAGSFVAQANIKTTVVVGLAEK